MVYAVNLCDWHNHVMRGDAGLTFLFIGTMPGYQQVDCEPGRIDGMSILLEVDETRADAIVQIARKKYKKHELRFYQSKTGNGGWKRV